MILVSYSVLAQSKAKTEYENFKEYAISSYSDFRDRVNKEYAKLVEQAWKWYVVKPVITKPKEKLLPPVVIQDNDQIEVVDNPIIIQKIINTPEIVPQPIPIAPIKEDLKSLDNTITINLYGTNFSVRVPNDVEFRMDDISNVEVAKVWKKLSTEKYNNLIRDCLEHRISKQLNDWAYLRLIDSVCYKIFDSRSDEAEIMKAYIYSQSGYQMRIANFNGHLKMLFGTKHKIYGMPYWEVDGIFYYGGNDVQQRIQICDVSYPGERPMSLYICQLPKLTLNPANLRMIQSNDVDWMQASVREDINLMKYLGDYPTSQIGDDPLTRWMMYAQTPISDNARTELYPSIRKWIKDKSSVESVDCICHWIQTGFTYEFDDKIWGQDRAFFADETLFYPYCDCEDRSILLTRIVRDLLGLKCALVYYPGHLATAISLGEDVEGDYIRIDGEKFIICDPTYINAPIGLTMPGMDNNSAKVILLR